MGRPYLDRRLCIGRRTNVCSGEKQQGPAKPKGYEMHEREGHDNLCWLKGKRQSSLWGGAHGKALHGGNAGAPLHRRTQGLSNTRFGHAHEPTFDLYKPERPAPQRKWCYLVRPQILVSQTGLADRYTPQSSPTDEGVRRRQQHRQNQPTTPQQPLTTNNAPHAQMSCGRTVM